MLQDHPATLWTFVSSFCALLFCYLGYSFSRGAPFSSHNGVLKLVSSLSSLRASFVLFSFAIGFRILASGQGLELKGDAQTFQAWGAAVARMGTGGLYRSEMMIDYPPIYLWVLGFFSQVQSSLGLDFGSSATARLFHMGPLVCDFIFAWILGGRLVYGLSNADQSAALAQRLIWTSGLILSPTLVANASLFGQVDSVPLLLLFISAVYLSQSLIRSERQSILEPTRPLVFSACFFALAMLTKPIAALFGPLGLCLAFAGHRLKALLIAAGCGVATIAVVLALASGFDFSTAIGIIKIYGGTLVSYPYLTLNAANVYALFGLNWKDAGQELVWGLNGIVIGKIMLSLALLGSSALAIRDLRRRREPEDITESVLFYGGVCLTLIFIFVDQMHERYLFVAAGLLLAAFCARPSLRGAGIALSAIFLSALNHTFFLDFHKVTGGYHVPIDSPWLIILGACHLHFGLFVLWSAVERTWRSQDGLQMHSLLGEWCMRRGVARAESPVQQARLTDRILSPESEQLSQPLWNPWQGLRRSEIWGLMLVVALSACLSFFRLGTWSSPESFWRARPQSDAVKTYKVTPDQETLPKIYFFLGLGLGQFAIDVSSDGTDWTEIGQIGHQSIFDAIEWSQVKSNDDPFQGRVSYFRIRYLEQDPDAFLDVHEVVLRPNNQERAQAVRSPDLSDIEWNTISLSAQDGHVRKVGSLGTHESGVQTITLQPLADSVSARSGFGSAASDLPIKDALTDEPSTFVEHPDAQHGMIFDEVYHVRSAWEEIRGDSLTETSHPTFGKTLIGLGISFFGLSPWAWRVVGVLCGLAMIPLVFLCTRLLTGGGMAPLLAALLFSFDFMRYTQTRLATLDGIAVFFVLATFASVLLYGRALSSDKSLMWRSGLLIVTAALFGMGLAVKWSVLYLLPVLVMAIAFFACEKLRRIEPLHDGKRSWFSISRKMAFVWLRSDGLLAILAFSLIPLGVYFGAYALSFWRTGAEVSWSNFWFVQKSMYTYHSELSATHPYSSSWWEWPFVLRPLWIYFSEAGEASEGFSQVRSIVTMGNPILWWMSPFALGLALVFAWSRRETKYILPAMAALGLYLPWVISPRSLTFIYHFFPVVPFCLMIQAVLISEYVNNNWKSRWVWSLVTLSAGCFFLFFPVLSGMPVSREYVGTWLRWFPSWVF